MKQQITPEQFTQLPTASQEHMTKWAARRGYGVQLSIGQQLEMLLEQHRRGYQVEPRIETPQICYRDGRWMVWVGPAESEHQELCDGLWQVIRALARQADRLRR